MRLVLPILIAAIIIGILYHQAYPALRTDQETPSFRPETTKERGLPCVRHKIMVFAIRSPEGKSIPIMVARVTVPCEGN